jgi:anti-anti-sigma factor
MHDQIKLSEIQAPGGAVVIRVQGELTASTTPALVKRCQSIREEGKNLVLNLAEVSFIASNGVGGLLAMVEDYRDAGQKLRLVSLSTATDSVIRLLNLDRFFDIDASEGAALRALGS